VDFGYGVLDCSADMPYFVPFTSYLTDGDSLNANKYKEQSFSSELNVETLFE
jgi:hypothetical protein